VVPAAGEPRDRRRRVGAHDVVRYERDHVERRVGGVVDELVHAPAGLRVAEGDEHDEELLLLRRDLHVGADFELRFDAPPRSGRWTGWW
jgi:hypothetical protein